MPPAGFPCLGADNKGTDVDPYASTYGGICVNMAINIKAHFTLYTGEDIYAHKGEDIVPLKGKKPFVHAFLREYGHRSWHDSKYVSDFDGLLESGLGSSAASAVAILGALNREQDLRMSDYDIAMKAWDIEVNNLGLFGGKQDQFASALGGFNVMNFEKSGVSVIPLPKSSAQKLTPHLVLFHMGKTRKSPTIQEGLKNLTPERIEILNQIKYRADGAVESLTRGDIKTIGRLMNEAWELKRASNSGVSNKEIDFLYYHGIKNGALAGKVLGAGGGGYILFLLEPMKDKSKFIKKMQKYDLEWWDFDISTEGVTARII